MGLVCSGPRQGKQFTYALLDERVPPTPALNREESLAALSLRYFASRGPATLADFVWWSGLTMQDARAGVATLPARFVRETLDGKEHFFVPTDALLTPAHQTTFLLPDYDEYGISYRNRSALFVYGPPVSAGNGTYDHVLVVNGVASGAWKCTLNKNGVAITPSVSLTEAQKHNVHTATDRYLFFVGNSPNF
ncbi:MAG: AlkZ family DNA glycosylase [Sphingobacteriaceae bacterium]|nr:AlkZ family DNA glycosylase [Cytophagaceae bacterium]